MVSGGTWRSLDVVEGYVFTFEKKKLGGGFHFDLSKPHLGEMIQFDRIFFFGWVLETSS